MTFGPTPEAVGCLGSVTVTGHRTRGSWLTNHLANPALTRVLRGPYGHRLGRRLAVLSYRGRRTGLTRQLVVQYVRDGDRVWVVPGRPDRKQWWRNLVEPRPVELWLAGEHLHGIACALDADEQPDDVADARTAYRAAVPRARPRGHPVIMVRTDQAARTGPVLAGDSAAKPPPQDVRPMRREHLAT